MESTTVTDIKESFDHINLKDTTEGQEETKGVANTGVCQMNKIRIAMLGNVDAGKSTMVGILTSAPGKLDDGRGAMRANVFNYAHEQKNGRTSSVAHEIMGFADNGE